ncbi:Protein CBG04714 [Caenorhabditis briggsae]|uniref:Protein CBG04714 n=1 Tax=Caenorhabditis briggsae TaxID=6238 RepID=A8WYA7_CAEBR|nr:Protein CBG04714 [Caenorhabditis briggsae]CAP25365.2 Protein CBG04714 [Caenorhabditis briggsae]
MRVYTILLLLQIPLNSHQLDCDWLTDKSQVYVDNQNKSLSYDGICCFEQVLKLLDTEKIGFVDDWRKAESINKFLIIEQVFLRFGRNCMSLQETATKLSSTTSSPIDCGWLATDFAVYDELNVEATFIYSRNCCSETAHEKLANTKFAIDIEDMEKTPISDTFSDNDKDEKLNKLKEAALTKLLYCIPNACPGLDSIWDNCTEATTTTTTTTLTTTTESPQTTTKKCDSWLNTQFDVTDKNGVVTFTYNANCYTTTKFQWQRMTSTTQPSKPDFESSERETTTTEKPTTTMKKDIPIPNEPKNDDPAFPSSSSSASPDSGNWNEERKTTTTERPTTTLKKVIEVIKEPKNDDPAFPSSSSTLLPEFGPGKPGEKLTTEPNIPSSSSSSSQTKTPTLIPKDRTTTTPNGKLEEVYESTSTEAASTSSSVLVSKDLTTTIPDKTAEIDEPASTASASTLLTTELPGQGTTSVSETTTALSGSTKKSEDATTSSDPTETPKQLDKITTTTSPLIETTETDLEGIIMFDMQAQISNFFFDSTTPSFDESSTTPDSITSKSTTKTRNLYQDETGNPKIEKAANSKFSELSTSHVSSTTASRSGTFQTTTKRSAPIDDSPIGFTLTSILSSTTSTGHISTKKTVNSGATESESMIPATSTAKLSVPTDTETGGTISTESSKVSKVTANPSASTTQAVASSGAHSPVTGTTTPPAFVSSKGSTQSTPKLDPLGTGTTEEEEVRKTTPPNGVSGSTTGKLVANTGTGSTLTPITGTTDQAGSLGTDKAGFHVTGSNVTTTTGKAATGLTSSDKPVTTDSGTAVQLTGSAQSSTPSGTALGTASTASGAMKISTSTETQEQTNPIATATTINYTTPAVPVPTGSTISGFIKTSTKSFSSSSVAPTVLSNETDASGSTPSSQPSGAGSTNSLKATPTSSSAGTTSNGPTGTGSRNVFSTSPGHPSRTSTAGSGSTSTTGGTTKSIGSSGSNMTTKAGPGTASGTAKTTTPGESASEKASRATEKGSTVSMVFRSATPVPDGPATEASTKPVSIPTSTRPVTTVCPALSLDLGNTVRPTTAELKSYYAAGEQVVHMCKKYHAFELAGQPFKVYVCKNDGTWAGAPEKCVAEKRKEL